MTTTQMTVKEAASSESTATELQKLWHVSLAQLNAKKFDVAELGEAYEGIAKDFPLVGQYVEARRKLFAEADKRGFGRGLRVLYHAAEAGARITATLYASAAQLAASNYGAAGAVATGAAGLLAAAAGPLGLGLALGAAILTLGFGERAPTPAEAMAMAEQFAAQRKTARDLLDILDDGKHSAQRFVAQNLGFYQRLEDLAGLGDDPTSFLANPRLRDMCRRMLAQAGVSWALLASDAVLAAEAKKRAAKIQKAWEEGLRRGKKAGAGRSLASRLAIGKALPKKAHETIAALRAKEVKKVTTRVHAISKANTAIAALRNTPLTIRSNTPATPVVPRAQMLTQEQAEPNNDLVKVGLGLVLAIGAYKLLS